ncbi:MAG: hypothetical protein H0W73_15855 [Bacteroidetes bacterium]|nr:hypothetical protein [Bacteroidota bacterium]
MKSLLKTIFAITVGIMVFSACGPSSPKDFTEEIQECYGNAAISDMGGKTEEAKAYKDKARILDLKAREKFANDPKKLAEYNESMQFFKLD